MPFSCSQSAPLPKQAQSRRPISDCEVKCPLAAQAQPAERAHYSTREAEETERNGRTDAMGTNRWPQQISWPARFAARQKAVANVIALERKHHDDRWNHELPERNASICDSLKNHALGHVFAVANQLFIRSVQYGIAFHCFSPSISICHHSSTRQRERRKEPNRQRRQSMPLFLPWRALCRWISQRHQSLLPG